MSREITNTKSSFQKYPLIPEGRHMFMVAGPVKKIYGKNNSEFFVWPLQYKNPLGPGSQIGEQSLMPSMLGPLLRVIGCQETEPGVFDWDTNEVEGCVFVASVSHVPDKKDPSITRVHLSEYAPGRGHEIGD